MADELAERAATAIVVIHPPDATHAPYTPSQPYLELFDDGWAPPPKKKHRLAAGISDERLASLRRTYDQFVAIWDNEFGRLLDNLESSGLLENSYMILTSDHGEIFGARRARALDALVFEPNIRVPLMISAPGQRQRQDVFALTSNVDLLPSLLHIAGLPAPDWSEGLALPGLGGVEIPDRSIYLSKPKLTHPISHCARLRWLDSRTL